MQQLTFLDLCSGIGGFRLGLESAGHKCIGYCEYDRFARASYEAMYDTEGEWKADDVTKLKSEDVPYADIWCFGFPCQDISVAGKQRGLVGERSGIYYNIIDLIKGKEESDKPTYLLVENVKNLLSINSGFDFASVLSEMDEAGYDCRWQVLNSKDFGVPQNRERVFIIANLRSRGGREILPLCGENAATLNQLVGGMQGYRVYGTDGISATLVGNAGGVGAKTGLYLMGNLNPSGHGQGGNVYHEDGIAPTVTVNKGCGTRIFIDQSNHAPKLTENARCITARYTSGMVNHTAMNSAVIGVFADQGISGYCENRPQFQRMMEKARAGEIDLIITKSISRFARNTVTVLKFARELKELGVGIFFEEQNINTLSGDGEMMLAVLASFAQEESRSMSENNKWSIRKKFERGEVMITTSRFLGYDKNEYGDLIVNRKEAEIVSLTFDLYLLNVGSSRIGELLDYLGVKTVTGTTWESGTINGMLCNEKYKGDFHLQKYYTPENKRNHTRKNNGEVQSYYISENHEPIVSPEVWEKVQEVREQRKRDRNIGQDSTMKFQNRYPLSGMLICPYCGKTLRRRQVYKKKIQWLCSTYIEKGVKACKGIRIDDAELQGLNITEQTVIEEVVKNGKKHYCYTSKADFDCGIRNSTVSAEIEDGSVLPSVNRPRRTVIKL